MQPQPQYPHAMTFEFTPSDNGLDIKVNTKRFDATNTDKFKATFEEYTAEPIENVSVNLHDVEFIDSSGIGVLINIQKKLKEGSDPVRIIDAQPAVISIIELLRLQRVFTLESSKNVG